MKKPELSDTYVPATDKFALSLSALCAVHCLVFPLLLTLLPSLAVLPVASEVFHFCLLLGVIPSSAYALTLGCRKHGRYRVLVYGAFGVFLLVSALLAGAIFGGVSEKVLTLMGAAIVALAHVQNYRLCRTAPVCGCASDQ